MSRCPERRAYSCSSWTRTRSGVAGGAPCQRSPGCPISKRSWERTIAGTSRLFMQCLHEVGQGLVLDYGQVSCGASPHGPSNGLALETPHQPADLRVREVLGRASGVHPDGSPLARSWPSESPRSLSINTARSSRGRRGVPGRSGSSSSPLRNPAVRPAEGLY